MCDTLVATGDATSDGSIILAKNSDREPNEVQLINHVLEHRNMEPTSLSCTYINVPDSKRTNEILISRPYWMWGCEMGINACGVSIGNEAVFTKEPYSHIGLTGMDLIRLALERSNVAARALEIITGMLHRYGQGGNCGMNKKLFYHNSFIIADRSEAWVLETAGKHWVAKKIEGVYSISNGLTIEEEFDYSSRGIEDYALLQKYMKKTETFSFRKAFSDTIYTHFSKCHQRRKRSMELLNHEYGNISPYTMMNILRDHGKNESFKPPHKTNMGSLCMHASLGPLRANQSTSSMITHHRKSLPTCWMTGSSSPCTSIFKPFYLVGKAHKYINNDATEFFSPDINWWKNELLHRQALLKYSHWHNHLAPQRNDLEKRFYKEECKLSHLVKKQKRGSAQKLMSFAEACFDVSEREKAKWTKSLDETPLEPNASPGFRLFWKWKSKDVDMPADL